MSPRAAWRLETLGFTQIFDYEAGKSDWFAAGLPREGEARPVLRAGDMARRNDVTCELTESVGTAARRAAEAGTSYCIVTNDQGIVLGRLRERVLAGDLESLAEDVMESGPSTVRPDTPVASMLERMRGRGVETVVVTASTGGLIGTLYAEDAEERLGDPDDDVSCDCDPVAAGS